MKISENTKNEGWLKISHLDIPGGLNLFSRIRIGSPDPMGKPQGLKKLTKDQRVEEGGTPPLQG